MSDEITSAADTIRDITLRYPSGDDTKGKTT
jgi:hypothetical protein